ncbi:MAG: STAS domain-containing protein [Victivallaceae bacterium]
MHCKSYLQVNSYDKNEITVVEITGRLDAGSAPGLKARLVELCRNQINFVFDLSEMDSIDSTGLGCIITCRNVVSKNNGNVRLACPQAKPQMVFEITRAHKIFDIFDDLDAAIESFHIASAQNSTSGA